MRTPTIRAILAMVLAVSCVAAWSPAFASTGDAKKGKEKFHENMRCTACHGESGKGDGPAAVALNPKPRNFTDGNLMNPKTDEHLFKVIKEGGLAVGLSPLMSPWAGQISDQDIKDIIAFIRTLANPPHKAPPAKKK